MKSSKLLLTSLLAAAAMGTTAFGVTTTTTVLDDVTYSGTIWTTDVSVIASGKTAAPADGDNLSSNTRTYTDGTNTYVGNTSNISGVGYFYNYFFNASETQYVGNTLRLTGATGDHRINTDWSNYVWLGGLITDESDYTYTIGRDPASSDSNFKLKGTAGVNMLINADTVIWGKGIEVLSSGTSENPTTNNTWTVAANKTLTLKADTTTFEANTVTTIGGSGTVKFMGATTALSNVAVNGSLSVASGATLDLSASKITLASTITNSGTVTVTSGTVFNLTRAESMTLVSGSGLIVGYDTLSGSNFTYNGADIGRSTLTISGTEITYNYVAAKALTWNGGATGGTWDTTAAGTTATNTPWQNAEGNADGFYTGDSVSFDTASASVEVSGTVNPGTMTVSAATNFAGSGTISVAAANLTASATLNLGKNVTLDLGALENGTNVNLGNLTGTGTVSVSKSTASGYNHDHIVNFGTNFAGTINYSGNLNPVNATLGSSEANVNFTNVWFWSATSSAEIAQTLNFSGTANKITAGTLTLTGAITAATGSNFSITGTSNAPAVLTLTDDTVKNFATLTLSNAYSTLNISGGTTTIASLTQSAGTTNISGGTTTIASLTQSAGTTNISGGTTTISGGSLTAGSLVVSGAGRLTATLSSIGTATLTLNGTGVASAVEVTGTIGAATLNIQNGSLTWTHNGANRTSGANITIGAGSTFKDEADYKYSLTLSGKLSGAGTLYSGVPTIEGQGDGFRTVTLSGSTADFTGEWQLETASADSGGGNRRIDGVLNSSDGVFGGVVSFTTLQGTTVDEAITSSKLSLAKDMEIGGLKGTLSNTVVGSNDTNSRALTINTVADANYDYAGTIASTISGITKKGTGTQTLAGASTAFNGSVTVSGGVLALADAAAIGTGNAVRIEGGQLKVGNGTTAVSLNAAAYTIVLSDAYSADSGTGVAAIIGTSETNKSSVALTADTKITIDDIAVSIAAESAQYQYKIFDTTTIDDGTFTVNNFALSTSLESIGWAISGYNAGVLTLTIPEPSVFGLLAGLGALALAGTRRRRRKA